MRRFCGENGDARWGHQACIVCKRLWATHPNRCDPNSVAVSASFASGGIFQRWNWHGIFLVTLGVIGFVVAYQVRRVRALSRYYEGRPLP